MFNVMVKGDQSLVHKIGRLGGKECLWIVQLVLYF